MKKQFTLAATALIAGLSILSACKKEEVAKKYASLNVVHASPNAAGFNVTVSSDSAKNVNDFVLQYLGNTGYKKVEAGTHKLNIKSFMVGMKDSIVTNTELILTEKKHYSVFIIDSFSNTRTLFVADDWANPENGKAMIRMLQLSPNAPMLDVTNNLGNVIYGNMDFRDVSGYTAIDAGVYQWQLRLANTDTKLYQLPTMVFNTGKVYTIYIHGLDNVEGEKRLTTSMIINKD